MATRTKTIIYLLRNDLRFHDNEALQWAHRNAEHYILPLYCFDPDHYKGTYHFGIPKTGSHRFKFLLECLSDLRTTLKSHGSNLVVRQGKPDLVIKDMLERLGRDNCKICYHEEATQEETDVENRVSQCEVPTQSFWGSTLHHKDDLPFRIKDLPNVFTQFRQQAENRGKVRPLVTVPETLKPLPPGIDEGDLPSLADFGLEEVPEDKRSAFPFCGGESSAVGRLEHYLWGTDSVAQYKETRNGMIGPEYSTKLSAWLAHGCLSPRKIYWEIKKYESSRTSNQSTYWVIFELLWRDYFRFVGLKFGNKLFYRDGIMGKYVAWKQDKKLFDAWREGRTGVPYVDANMRELAATGFMSNRGRQNVASFLVKDLQLDWRMGAEYFESLLVDHDVCSNYGNWQYSAGIGNDPRQDRKFNMVKQGLDYDPQGEYVRLWVAELAGIKTGAVHTPWTMGNQQLASAGVTLGNTYPHPLVRAPEWGRHSHRQKSGREERNKSGRGRQRGMDFYFKNSNPL